MTPQALPFDAEPTLTERIATLFRSHPGEPIDVADLAAVGGISGYRTRVSEARRHLGMDIRPERPMRRWPDGRPRPMAIYYPTGTAQ